MAEMALQRDHVLGIDTISSFSLSTVTSALEAGAGERKPLVEEIRRVNGVYDTMEPVLKFERDGVAYVTLLVIMVPLMCADWVGSDIPQQRWRELWSVMRGNHYGSKT